jgi:hypothetical protein
MKDFGEEEIDAMVSLETQFDPHEEALSWNHSINGIL